MKVITKLFLLFSLISTNSLLYSGDLTLPLINKQISNSTIEKMANVTLIASPVIMGATRILIDLTCNQKSSSIPYQLANLFGILGNMAFMTAGGYKLIKINGLLVKQNRQQEETHKISLEILKKLEKKEAEPTTA